MGDRGKGAKGAKTSDMQLRDRALLGVVIGGLGGGAAVLLGQALTHKKNNRIQFDGVAATSTEGINSDRYLAIRLKELQTDFGEHDAAALQTIISTFEDMISLYGDARRAPQAFYGWKATQYDQTIQANILVLTRKAVEEINRVRARLERDLDARARSGDGKADENPEILIKLVNLTRELRSASTGYCQQIQAAAAL